MTFWQWVKSKNGMSFTRFHIIITNQIFWYHISYSWISFDFHLTRLPHTWHLDEWDSAYLAEPSLFVEFLSFISINKGVKSHDEGGHLSSNERFLIHVMQYVLYSLQQSYKLWFMELRIKSEHSEWQWHLSSVSILRGNENFSQAFQKLRKF